MSEPGTIVDDPQKDTGTTDSQGQDNQDPTKDKGASENKSDKGNEGGETLTLKAITKREDGKYEFRVDPEDPESSVYVGDSPDEALENARKGIKEKDTVIRKAQRQEKLTVKRKEDTDDKDHPKVKLPDADEIAERHFEAALKRARIPLEQAQNINNREWWKKYRDDNNLDAEDVMEIKMRINRVLDQTNSAIDKELREQTAIYKNDQVFQKVSKVVGEMLEDAKVPVDQVGEGKAFDFSALIDRCLQNLEADEILDSGDVIAEAHKVIRQIQASQNKGAVRKKLEEDAEKARKAADLTASPAGTGGERKTTIVPAADYRTATKTYLKQAGLTD